MSCKQLTCEGTDAFFKLIEGEKGTSKIFVLFTGSKDSNSGESWCPDCVKADPVIKNNISKIPSDAVFITCSVGDRSTWKDPASPFRTHPKLLLKGVPTLMKWGTPERLGDSECSKDELVSMLFEE
ncbi:thioredoxin domain-containing protein 17-like [Hydractinia symbiolongicarpus]|uniref:thioredoxin domain-containing protein 17-like n=1 Tax=Hydractinia symbiolongicarpus TaxID=13093 RepID=UPI00254FCFED|nr:thioredoxin domain-containing protein 17-like [Hydractinia symbiolongicarpus]